MTILERDEKRVLLEVDKNEIFNSSNVDMEDVNNITTIQQYIKNVVDNEHFFNNSELIEVNVNIIDSNDEVILVDIRVNEEKTNNDNITNEKKEIKEEDLVHVLAYEFNLLAEVYDVVSQLERFGLTNATLLRRNDINNYLLIVPLDYEKNHISIKVTSLLNEYGKCAINKYLSKDYRYEYRKKDEKLFSDTSFSIANAYEICDVIIKDNAIKVMGELIK